MLNVNFFRILTGVQVQILKSPANVIAQKYLPVKNFSLTCQNYSPRFTKNVQDDDYNTVEQDTNAKKTVLPPRSIETEDVNILKNVEENLFDNLTYAPVSKNLALRQSKAIKKPKWQDRNLEVEKRISPQKSKVISPVIDDANLDLKYTKLQLGDNMLPNLLMTARSKRRRDKHNQIVIEGRRLILEAISCGFNLQSLIFSQKDQLGLIKTEIKKFCKKSAIYKVPHHDLKTWSTLVTPPGVIGIFDRPENENHLIKNEISALPLTVICDNIREPNNLGAAIRICAAIPCSQVIVLKGCSDPWESKALRGGCGAQFRIKILDDINWEEIPNILQLKKNITVFIAENKIERKIDKKYPFQEYSQIEIGQHHNVVIIGGETHGISDEAYRFLSDNLKTGSTSVHIPLANEVESLNTSCALTLILYEMRKKILEKKKCIEFEKENILGYN